jgi:trans-aconitate methyltransferase
MKPSVTGLKYDKIAAWWNQRHFDSTYGVEQLTRAIGFSLKNGNALDVGCGAGGRMVQVLNDHGYDVMGLDTSSEMIRLARQNHPQDEFHIADIGTWHSDQKFEFILAWDSLFHLPLPMQKAVLTKLCNLLNKGGVLIYTFGDAIGEHEDQWHQDTFYYSSIGIDENLKTLAANGLCCKHLERDQWPEKHVYIIAEKT